MSDLVITIISVIGSSLVSGWAGWFFARKKYNVEVEAGQIENLKSRVDLVNDIVDTLKEELDRLNLENASLREENKLMDLKVANLTTIILKHGIDIKKEMLHE